MAKFDAHVKGSVETLIGAIRTMIEDLRAFNKYYAKVLTEKKEEDCKVFVKIENLLTSFHERLSKFDVRTSNLISQ